MSSTALQVREDSKQLAALKRIGEQATPKNEIRIRQGRGGMQLKYTDGAYVIRTLNDAFGWDWDFVADNEELLTNNGKPFEVKVRGTLTVRLNGQAVTKTQFGCQPIEMLKNGESPVSIGDAYKGAATDAMKKCASLLGVALDLYDSDYRADKYTGASEQEGSGDDPARDPHPKSVADLVTPKQLWMLRNLGRELGIDVERAAQGRFKLALENISKRSASMWIEELKNNGTAVEAEPEPVEAEPEPQPTRSKAPQATDATTRQINALLGFLKWDANALAKEIFTRFNGLSVSDTDTGLALEALSGPQKKELLQALEAEKATRTGGRR